MGSLAPFLSGFMAQQMYELTVRKMDSHLDVFVTVGLTITDLN